MTLADLVAQLEAAKFLRLYRHLTDAPEYAQRADELNLPSSPIPTEGAELMLKRFGHVGSLDSRIMSWIFQIVHMPVGVWTSPALDLIMDRRLEQAFASLAALSDPAQYFKVVSQNSRNPDWTGPDRAYYYVFTNVMHDTAEPALVRLVSRARELFEEALPNLVRPRFGLGTPGTLALKAEEETEDFVKTLLREPSGLQLIAREGRITVSAFSEHGEYAAGGRGSASMSTATRSIHTLKSSRGARLADLEDLVNARGTSEGDLQRFFAENPDFLRTNGGGFGEVRPHLCLIDGSGHRPVPDFMARLEDEGTWSAIELKLPRHPIVVQTAGGPAPSAMAARAVAQLITYRDHFISPDNRRKVAAAYGASPFEPALVVVIGRDREARRFRWDSRWKGHPAVDVVSYDFLLERARDWVGKMEGSE